MVAYVLCRKRHTCINGFYPQCEDCVGPGGPDVQPMASNMTIVLPLHTADDKP